MDGNRIDDWSRRELSIVLSNANDKQLNRFCVKEQENKAVFKIQISALPRQGRLLP